MAANLAQLNGYLNNTLNLSDVMRAAVNAQGLQSFDAFQGLTDNDIKDICKNVRSPGGMIPDPANAGQQIPNRGVAMGHLHEKRLRMLNYFVNHLVKIQRPFQVGLATLARLLACWRLKEAEDEDVDIDNPEKLKNVDHVRQVLENIDHVLTTRLGANQIPLAYVTRDVVALPAAADDPGFGLPNLKDELIRRAPHNTETYVADNQAVWNVIRHVTHETNGWSWVQSFARRRDGRGAYLSMKQHYLGESFQAKIKTTAEKVLDTAFFDGKKRNYTFDKYISALKGAFSDLEQYGEPLSEDKKIRTLLKGISDPTLITATSQIMATPALQASLDDAATFLQRFIDTQSSLVGRNRQLANTTSGGRHAKGGRGGGRGGRGSGRGRGGRNDRKIKSAFDPSDPGRSYSRAEYNTLTKEQRAKCYEAREGSPSKRKVASATTDDDDDGNKKRKPDGVGDSMTRRPSGRQS